MKAEGRKSRRRSSWVLDGRTQRVAKKKVAFFFLSSTFPLNAGNCHQKKQESGGGRKKPPSHASASVVVVNFNR